MDQMRADTSAEQNHEQDRRFVRTAQRPVVAGVPVREGDVETTDGLHSIAILFRVLAGMLVALMILQIISGVTGSVDISYGVLAGEAVRLLIFAALLWAGGDLADLFIKSHHDLRAARILLGRLLARAPDASNGSGDSARGRGDGVH